MPTKSSTFNNQKYNKLNNLPKLKKIEDGKNIRIQKNDCGLGTNPQKLKEDKRWRTFKTSNPSIWNKEISREKKVDSKTETKGY